MDSDDRFKHLATDPRFKTLRKKQRKVKIDERFQSMFTDEKFTLKYNKDKRGRNQKKTSGDDLKKYYALEKEAELSQKDKDRQEDDDEKPVNLADNDADDITSEHQDSEPEVNADEESDDGSDDLHDEQSENEQLEAQDGDEDEELESDDESVSDVSTSSDEPESDQEHLSDNDAIDELDIDKIQYDWLPLDHDAEKAEKSSNRLAIQNLDWDHLDVRDIYTLVNSVRPPLSIKVYVSEFGKERLAKEEIHGPQELVEMPTVDEDEEECKQLEEKMIALENKKAPGVKSYGMNEYEDADDPLDPKNDEVRERIRRYQLSRMKYYYAVAEFDCVESAEAVYKELDGMEYEGSSLELDLRFIPDDMEFDSADMKAECNKMPDLASYTAPQFINSALQQTTVKFTWDQTDHKRDDKLRRAYTKEDLEKDDLGAYLASETDSEDDDNANAKSAEKYKALLASLEDEEATSMKKSKNKKDEDEDEVEENSDEEEDDEEDEGAEEEEEEDGKARAPEVKVVKRARRSRPDVREKEPDDNLELIVMDERAEEFRFNPDDDRFKAIYESGLYNIDPSHPKFKRTNALDQIAEKKRQKRRKRESS